MRFARFISILALVSPPAMGAETGAKAVPGAEAPMVIATVNGRAISVADFDQALVAAVRQRFYHRAPPEGEMATVRREVADALIDLMLASAEAKRRGNRFDSARIARDLERIESRFRNRPGWAEHREPQLARWRADLEERYLAEALEKQVRAAVSVTPEQVRDYYEANPTLFTEPEKVRMGLILLKVDPSAGKVARDRAREEAVAIRARLAKGADFAELARIHSGDDSAAKGGDLGFVHRGALPEPVQAVVDTLDGGRFSEPVDVLEGIAIVRISDRRPQELRPLDAVADRARDLLLRKSADEAWKSLATRLRSQAAVKIDTRRFPDLAAAPEAGKAGPPPER